MYRAIISDLARKDLKSLPQEYQELVLNKISSLTANPSPLGTKKLYGEKELYRIRQGPYRILYRVDDTKQEVTVARVRPRREAYR